MTETAILCKSDDLVMLKTQLRRVLANALIDDEVSPVIVTRQEVTKL
jgi:hypothetical protein